VAQEKDENGPFHIRSLIRYIRRECRAAVAGSARFFFSSASRGGTVFFLPSSNAFQSLMLNRKCVCVYVCVRERQRESMHVYVCVSE